MNSYIQIGLRCLGISIINDINHEDLLYISLNPTKDMWTETRNFNVKPVEYNLNKSIEEYYKKYQENFNEQQTDQKYQIDKNRVRIIYSFKNIDFFLFISMFNLMEI